MMSPASKFVCKSKLRAGYVHLELTDPTKPERDEIPPHESKNPQLSELSLAQSKIVFADRYIHLEHDRYQPHPDDKQRGTHVTAGASRFGPK